MLKESVEDDAEAVKKFIKYDDVTVYGDKIHNGIKSLIFVTDNEGHMFEDLEDALSFDKAIDKFLNAFDRLWAYRKEKMLNKLN